MSFDKMQPTTKRHKLGSVDIFISHAGPDKLPLARPLLHKLQAKGLRVFLDKKSMEPGDDAPDEMTKAMESARIGVFILSPEFAARKWTMKELRCFLRRRREAPTNGLLPPILLPVFYRLSIRECRELDLDRYEDNEGKNIFEVEKFYSEERQREATTDVVKGELQEITTITGIENDEKATNRIEDEFSHDAREALVKRIAMWVMRKYEERKLLEMGQGSAPVTEGFNGISSAVGEGSSEQRPNTPGEINLQGDVFRASFYVPRNPPHVVLKFGHRSDADEDGEDANGVPPEERLRESLLDLNKSDSVVAVGARIAETVGMNGMGGIGKSCALRGLPLDNEIRARFRDGIYWLALGQDATERNMVEQLARITRESGGKVQAKEVREGSNLDSAISIAREWFEGKTILLLLDDVWEHAAVGSDAVVQLRQIADAERGSRVAFTAREWGLVDGSQEIKFSPKENRSALEILLECAGMRGEQIEDVENEIKRVLKFCGGLPLALSVAGRAIAMRRKSVSSLKDTLEEYLEELQDEGMLNERVPGYMYKNLSSAFAASLSMMDRNKTTGESNSMSYAKMYESLVVIQRQGWLPLSVLCALWGRKKVQARRVLQKFVEASLLERADGEKEAGVTLHDLQLDYVQRRCGSGEEEKWHLKVVRGWEWKESESVEGSPWFCGRGWKNEVLGDDYFRKNVCSHMRRSGLMDELREVLSDPRWAAEKLCRAEGLDLQEDFRLFEGLARERGLSCARGGTVWSLQKIARETRLSAYFAIRSSREVWFQLYDRLLRLGDESEVVRQYLCAIEEAAEKPWLKSLTPRLSAPSALQDILQCEGAVEGMSGCAEKNEITAWGRSHTNLFRSTFNGAKLEKNVLRKVPQDARTVWSKNGKYATILMSDRLEVWNMCAGKRCGQDLTLGKCLITCWDLSGDGTRVAVGQGGVMKLWDVQENRKIKAVAPGHNIAVVSFSPDGKRLIYVTAGALCVFLCGKTGDTLTEHSLNECSFELTIVWSENGERVACGPFHPTNSFLIFTGDTGEQIREDGTPRELEVDCISWSVDGKMLLCARCDELSIWDVEPWMRIGLFRDNLGDNSGFGTKRILEMSVSRDGRWVVVAMGRYVSMWDAETRTNIWSDENQHDRDVLFVDWLEDGKQALSADLSGRIIVWGVAQEEQVWGRAQEEQMDVNHVPCRELRWSNNGMHVYGCTEQGNVVVYNVKTGQETWRDTETHASSLSCLSLSGDDKLLFSHARDGKVATWDFKSGKKLWEELRGDRGEGYIAAHWSNNGAKIATLNGEQVIIWDGKTGERQSERQLERSLFRHVAWSGDTSKIVTAAQVVTAFQFTTAAGYEKEAMEFTYVVRTTVLSSTTLESIYEVVSDRSGLGRFFKWSPGDKWIASAAEHSCTVEIRRGENDAIFRCLMLSNEFSCLEWFGDRRVSCGTKNGEFHIWDFELEEEIQAPRANASLNQIAWSQDGSRVATLHADRTVRVFSVNMTTQEVVCKMQFDDILGFFPGDLRQFMNTTESAKNPDRKLKIRVRGDGVFYKTEGNETRLATMRKGEWQGSTAGRHLVISISGKPYFFKLVE